MEELVQILSNASCNLELYLKQMNDLSEEERLEYVNVYCSDELKQKLEN